MTEGSEIVWWLCLSFLMSVLVYVCWRKKMISIFWDYWKSEKWLRIYTVYASITFAILVQNSDVKASIVWTQITRVGAMWLWFHCYSMRPILSALRMKKWDLCNSCFLCLEKELEAPHGSDSLWHCILPYPQWGLLQGGLCVRAFLHSAKK